MFGFETKPIFSRYRFVAQLTGFIAVVALVALFLQISTARALPIDPSVLLFAMTIGGTLCGWALHEANSIRRSHLEKLIRDEKDFEKSIIKTLSKAFEQTLAMLAGTEEEKKTTRTRLNTAITHLPRFLETYALPNLVCEDITRVVSDAPALNAVEGEWEIYKIKVEQAIFECQRAYREYQLAYQELLLAYPTGLFS